MYIISKQNVIAIYCLIVFTKEDVLTEEDVLAEGVLAEEDVLAEGLNKLQIPGKWLLE